MRGRLELAVAYQNYRGAGIHKQEYGLIAMKTLKRLAALSMWFALGAIAFGLATFNAVAFNANDAQQRTSRDVAVAESQTINVQLPSKDLSPVEVVELQLQSMRESLADPNRLIDCYSLASPANRQQTGPFSRFASMVRQSPYDQLARCAKFQIGGAAVEKEYAAVLVSTLDHRGEPRAFRFLLHRHSQPPYEGCWLTDAVRVLQPLTLTNGPAQLRQGGKID